MIEFNRTSCVPLSRGLYVGFVQLLTSVDSMRLLVARQMPNMLPNCRVRDNSHVSREEWALLKHFVHNVSSLLQQQSEPLSQQQQQQQKQSTNEQQSSKDDNNSKKQANTNVVSQTDVRGSVESDPSSSININQMSTKQSQRTNQYGHILLEKTSSADSSSTNLSSFSNAFNHRHQLDQQSHSNSKLDDNSSEKTIKQQQQQHSRSSNNFMLACEQLPSTISQHQGTADNDKPIDTTNDDITLPPETTVCVKCVKTNKGIIDGELLSSSNVHRHQQQQQKLTGKSVHEIQELQASRARSVSPDQVTSSSTCHHHYDLQQHEISADCLLQKTNNQQSAFSLAKSAINLTSSSDITTTTDTPTTTTTDTTNSKEQKTGANICQNGNNAKPKTMSSSSQTRPTSQQTSLLVSLAGQQTPEQTFVRLVGAAAKRLIESLKILLPQQYVPITTNKQQTFNSNNYQSCCTIDNCCGNCINGNNADHHQQMKQVSIFQSLNEDNNRIYDLELIELSDSITFILIVPTPENVCPVTSNDKWNILSNNRHFMLIPLQIFEISKFAHTEFKFRLINKFTLIQIHCRKSSNEQGPKLTVII